MTPDELRRLADEFPQQMMVTVDKVTLRTVAGLIESQAARIEELEADRLTADRSLVTARNRLAGEQKRVANQAKSIEVMQHNEAEQAARIAAVLDAAAVVRMAARPWEQIDLEQTDTILRGDP